MKRAIIIAAALVLILVAAILAWNSRKSGAGSYQTATVTRGPLTQTVTATGTLNPVVNVQVGSQISGQIQKLFADFNSPVKAGEVIAQIEPSIYKAIVAQGEGDLANAQAGLELAQITAKRTQSLVEKQNSSQSELDQAMATLHQAEAAVKVKQGALQRAKVDLENCTITSPIDGVVISRNVDVGQTVAASLNAPVIFIVAADLTNMQIDANVAEADVGAVDVDQDVDFTVDAFPTRTFHGKVKQVRNAPITVQNVVSYDTVISVSNPDQKLKPGMTANVSIVIAQRAEAVKVPNAALRFRMPGAEIPAAGGVKSSPGGRGGRGAGGGPRGERAATRTVYVLSAPGAEPKAASIKTGISDGVVTEVLEGLKEGDAVVIGSSQGSAAAARPSSNPFSGNARRGP